MNATKSSTPFVYKYVFPILFLGNIPLAIFETYNDQYLLFAALTYSLWFTLLFLSIPFKLKSISATADGITINHSRNSEEFIDYKDIMWVAKADLSCPLSTTIKYYDQRSGTAKKVAFNNRPKSRHPELYIREKVEHKSNYRDRQAPSNIKNTLIIVGISIFSVLLIVLFLREHILQLPPVVDEVIQDSL